MKRYLVLCCLLTASNFFGPPALCRERPVLPLRVPPGLIEFQAERGSFLEEFQVPEKISLMLSQQKIGSSLRLEAFPVEPGVRMAVSLNCVEVYAEGARVFVVEKGKMSEAPRSARIYFRGQAINDPEFRVAISVNPDSGTFRGISRTPDGAWSIAAPIEGQGYRIGKSEALRPDGAPPLQVSCGTEALPADFLPGEIPPALPQSILKAAAADPLYSATIAFDTDEEWLYYRFSNDTTAATTWIGDYINAANVMYERDLLLTLMIGTTYLRTGTSPFDDDPYSIQESPAGSAMLSEFGNYWAANYDGVDRVFAQLLSGKSSSSSSSSGIAWIDGYCEHQSSGGGYSVFEAFKATWAPMDANIRVGAHELGHNFGSRHTHCYSPPIDECYNQEGGCYSGTTSCPAGGQGTMMSYCHFNGCGDNQILFHSRVIDNINGYISAHTPWCIPEIGPADLIFQDGFEDGTTDAWSTMIS